MGNVFEESLFSKQPKQFKKIDSQAKAFAANYCGSTIIRDSIFGIVANYARKRELSLEILRYPFMDDELWAFTFVKKGTLFLCVNSELAMCRQIFAVAHELYHIHCYAEDIDPETITSGSLLDSKTVDDLALSKEDLEARGHTAAEQREDAEGERDVGCGGDAPPAGSLGAACEREEDDDGHGHATDRRGGGQQRQQEEHGHEHVVHDMRERHRVRARTDAERDVGMPEVQEYRVERRIRDEERRDGREQHHARSLRRGMGKMHDARHARLIALDFLDIRTSLTVCHAAPFPCRLTVCRASW